MISNGSNGEALGMLIDSAHSKSKKKPGPKGDAAVWLLKVVRPAADRNKMVNKLNESTFDKLPETIKSLEVEGEISVVDQVAMTVSHDVKSVVSHGGTKPVVVGTSTNQVGGKTQSIVDVEEGVNLILRPFESSYEPMVSVEFDKTINQPVETKGDYELNSTTVLKFSNTLPLKDDGATAMLSSTDGQAWILVVCTKMEK